MKKEELTHEMLKTLLSYDTDTGIFVWKERPLIMYKSQRECTRFNNQYAGKVATTLSKRGFYQIHIFMKSYKAITLAWFYAHGKWPKSCLDNIDSDKLNLKIKNIREATKTDIQQSRYKPDAKNKTGLIGVVPVKYLGETRYKARININRKTFYLGMYKTPEEAHEAYVNAKRQISPEFSML
jgi:hypothetical protein